MHQDIIYSVCGQVFVVAFLLQLHLTCGLSPLWDSVKTQVHQEYDVQEGNQVWVVRLDMGEHKSTDLVVGEDVRHDSRIILTCAAHHGPAEWVYSGDGRPEYTTNTTIQNLNTDSRSRPRARLDDMKGAKMYIATLTLGKNRLTSKDTGRYNCMTTSPETGLKYKTLSAFYHIYVPGDKLFIRQGGENVVYDLSKSAARIPCGVTNPKASVTLQRFHKGNLEYVPNEKMFYHPISGYYPKKEIPGTYVCTAGYNNTFELIHFTLIPTPSPSDLLYHNNIAYNKRKTTTRAPAKPEDLEWLIYATPSKTSSKKPATLLSQKPKVTSTPKPFYPYGRHTTTYGPFYTFYGTQSTSTRHPTHSNRRKTSGPPKFNPNLYPDEMIQDETSIRPPLRTKPTSQLTTSKITTRPSANNELEQKYHNPLIPHEIISYRPVFNFFKDTSRPSTSKLTTKKQSSSKKTPTTTTTVKTTTTFPTSPPSTRTTVRKYRPTTMGTTEIPVPIPDAVICSQSNCGTNAECYVHTAYYDGFQNVRREPACKCLKEHIGNPYLECYIPTPEMDEDTLYFNSSFRSPLIMPLRLFEHPDGESSSDSSSFERQGTLNQTVGIIDM